ncbi:MltA domain-containing protein [Tibeticola sp.]|uniref:murein transglycosylase A n=1 Tax=Tibeticola sp. TaxID=2005368 RepID=UPI0025F6E069|nr:MltA domain-containing protein [Tibeticola sp.]
MVHQTMNSRISSAPSASRKSSNMNRVLRGWATLAIVGMLLAALLAGCASVPAPTEPSAPPAAPLPPPADTADTAPLPPPIQQAKSRWVPVRWAELPGFDADALHEAWNAWLRSCERPGAALAALCTEVRQLAIGSAEDQRQWLRSRLQPYRVEALDGRAEGLLTSYYEPVFDASRLPRPGYAVPLFAPPAGLGNGRTWYSREQIDTLPAAREALRGRELLWLADPVDALMLQIQGSGRLRVSEPDGRVRLVRLAFAGTNGHPYNSVGRWLLDRGEVRDASWPGIKAWVARNPQRVQEMLWANPRVVFFREEPLDSFDAAFGPRGAQGVALTPGRSIAVDPQSIPYGTPVWLASSGPQTQLARLVLAQDTGSAITGAVRADYFAGWGTEAGELAGRLKQPLRLWVLWPRGQ